MSFRANFPDHVNNILFVANTQFFGHALKSFLSFHKSID